MYMGRNEVKNEAQKDNILRIFVIGDFGAYSYYRDLAGTTESMNNLALQHQYDHIITVGDNIYGKE